MHLQPLFKLFLIHSIGIFSKDLILEILHHTIISRLVHLYFVFIDLKVNIHTFLLNHISRHLLEDSGRADHEMEGDLQVFIIY